MHGLLIGRLNFCPNMALYRGWPSNIGWPSILGGGGGVTERRYLKKEIKRRDYNRHHQEEKVEIIWPHLQNGRQ